MKFSEFFKLDEKADKSGIFANSLKDAKDYTDERIKELEKKIAGSKGTGEEPLPKYTVVPSQSVEGDVLIIIDVEKGTMEGRLAARGRLVSHPLVYGTKVAFAVQRPNKDRMGAVHSLPDGQLVNQFRITGEDAEGTEISPIFRREEDTVKFVGDVFPSIMSAWIEDQNEDDPDIAMLRQLIQKGQEYKQPPPAAVKPAPSVPAPIDKPEYGAPTADITTLRRGAPRPAPQPAVQPLTPAAAPPIGNPAGAQAGARAARIRRLRARKHF